MKVLFVTSEVFPLAQTGGLADFSASVTREMFKAGHDVRLIMPAYKCVWDHVTESSIIVDSLPVPLGDRHVSCRVHQTTLSGNVPAYLIDMKDFYHREGIYEDEAGPFPDNAARFIFFSRAVIEVAKTIHFQPGIIHCNDWQTALTAALVKTLFRDDPFFSNTATVFTAHNIAYQGIFSSGDWPLTGLNWEYYVPEMLEYYGDMNLLKGGLVFSDIVTTVSKSYAHEITQEHQGYGLEGVFQSIEDKLVGVMNGVDYERWSPESDRWIVTPYSAKTLEGKGRNKDALLSDFGFKAGRERPLVSIVSRLDPVKGIDLVLKEIERMLALDLNLIILGTGQQRYHNMLELLHKKHQGQLSIHLKFDEKMAHRLFAASDVLLVPSLREPSGLTQLYAMKYGTVPVVHATGGLKDTVSGFDSKSGKGTGFLFKTFSGEAMIRCLKRCLKLYENKNSWQKLMGNCMNESWSWGDTSNHYIKLYKRAKKVCYDADKKK